MKIFFQEQRKGNVNSSKLKETIKKGFLMTQNRIFTSFFDNLNSINSDIIPISIAGRPPEWYEGLEYKKLAPKLSFFKVWEQTKDNEYYIDNYNKLISKTNKKYLI